MQTFADTTQVTMPSAAIVDVGRRRVKVITDVHLGHTHRDDFPILRELLSKWSKLSGHDAPHVAILGDFVDLLASPDDEFAKARYDPIWAALRKLSDDGRLAFVIGNHDLRLRDEIFGYLAPELPFVARWDERLLERYKEGLSGAPWSNRVGLDRYNACQRYVALRSGDAAWLLFHGDEINYGFRARRQLGANWRDLEFLLWRFLDTLPAAVNAVPVVLSAAIDRVWRMAEEAMRGGASEDNVPEGALAQGAPALLADNSAWDAFMEAFVHGLEDLPSDLESAGQVMAAGPDAAGVPRGFTLEEARVRASFPDIHDRPDPGTGPVQTLELSGMVFGHRHYQERRDFQDGGIPVVIDAGCWQMDMKPECLRSTVTTVDGHEATTRRGEEEL